MNAVISIKLAMLPVVLFGIAAGFGHVTMGAAFGAALALAVVLWRASRGPVPALELTILATLAAIAGVGAAGVALGAGDAAALGFFGVSIGTAASVLARKPWTAAYSGADYKGAEGDPLFLRINMILSGLWAGLFLWLAFARWMHVPPMITWLTVTAGVLTSTLLPRLWVRRNLQRRLDAQQRYQWSAPSFGVARKAADFDVVVVGAGIGGLTAGALLAQGGARVLVAEQHSIPGGYAHNWTWTGRDGAEAPVFRFDSGVHDVSGTWDGGPVHGILERLGLGDALEWKPLSHRFITDGESFDVPAGWDAYVDALARRFPADANGVRGAMADIRAIFEGMYSEGPAHSGVPGSPRSIDAMLAFAKRHPLVVRWMERPFALLLAAHGLGADAQRALTGLAGYVSDDPGALTVGAMVPLFGYYLHGGHYPLGGSGRLAQSLGDAIALDGGEVRLETPVKKVLIENGAAAGVELAPGEIVRAKAVVMNADFLAATRELIDPTAWPEDFRAELAKRTPACSAFCVHLGVRGTFPHAKPVIHVKSGRGAVGIVVPTLADPSAAPEGYSTVELIRLMPQAEAREWFADAAKTNDEGRRFSAAYRERKQAAGDELIRLAEEALPGLSSRIVCRTEASPLTFRRYDWSSAGAIYGSAGPAVQSKSPIPGLVFAGAATHGAGIEAVMISGALAAEALVPNLLATPAANESDCAGRSLAFDPNSIPADGVFAH